MKSFKFKSTDSGPDGLEGTVEAESAEMAIAAIKEEHKMYPGKYVLISRHEQIPFSIPRSPRESNETREFEPTETRELHSFGRKVWWVAFAIFPTPFVLMIGLFLWDMLKSGDKHYWLFPIIFFVGLPGCGLARALIIDKMLESFVCPQCHTPDDDWQRDEQYRVYYQCRECRIKWDIGYTFDPTARRRSKPRW